MKKIFVLSMLISVGMICSCQKQDSAAEQQLAQHKAELDAREKALAEREKAIAGPRRIPPDLQSRVQVRDPAQLKAERDRRLQQLPRDVQALIPDRSRIQAEKDEKDRMIQEQLAQRQRRMEELQRSRMAPAVKPGAAASPEAEATSPTPSPTPQ
jgi:chromosome segregation ATPase